MKYRLEEIAYIYDSLHQTPSYIENGISMVRVTDLGEGYLNLSKTLKVSEEVYNEFTKKYVPRKNDIIMSRVGTYGICTLVNTEEKFCLGQNTIIISPKGNKKFLYYYLISGKVREQIESLVTGSTQKTISLKNIKNIIVDLPNDEQQEKISNILDNIDKKIELNNKINDNLQELINNLFIKFFVNVKLEEYETKETELGKIPKNWKVGMLRDIVEFSNGYGFDSKKMLDKEVDDSYKVFKMGNINIGGGINKTKTKSWMRFEDCVGLDKFIAKKGDVLMCMTDMKNSGNPLLGHTALIDRDNEFVINQRVGLLRCNKGIDYTYVYTLSNLDFFISDIRSRANSGVQVNLTTKGICETKVIIPNAEILEKFKKIAKPIYEKKFYILKENENLIKLRDTLLPKLMNGEIELDNIEI